MDRAAARAAEQDRMARLGPLYERLGRYQWAAGDLNGGLEQMQRAVEIIPAGSVEGRASALATLAQHLMLDGRFAQSAALAREACEIARAAGSAAHERLGHATCTLGVDTPSSLAVRFIDSPLRYRSTASTLTRSGMPRGGVSVKFSPQALQR